MEVYSGEKANEVYGEPIWLPEETLEAIDEYIIAIKGPLTTPVGGGIRSLNVALRQGLILRLRAPGALLQRRSQPGEAPGKDEYGHLPREHRRYLRGHRVGGRHGSAKKLIEFLQNEMGVKQIRSPRAAASASSL